MGVEHTFLSIAEKNFPEITFQHNELKSKASFIKLLQPFINHLLTNDFSRLLQIIYRIDVPEREFTLTLQTENSQNPALEIASLIYDRLMLKAKVRAHYKNKHA